MAQEDIESRLRLEIKQALSKVSEANSPNIWKAIHTSSGKLNQTGYARVEARLIHKIIAGQLTPEGAIPQLEQEMDLS